MVITLLVKGEKKNNRRQGGMTGFDSHHLRAVNRGEITEMSMEKNSIMKKGLGQVTGKGDSQGFIDQKTGKK